MTFFSSLLADEMSLSYKFIILTLILINLSFLHSISLKSNGVILIGTKLKTIFEGKEYIAFYNIPYARPPISRRRYKPPQEYNPLSEEGVFDYRKSYRETFSSRYNEDCLYLSIFRPINSNKTQHFPVLVWMNNNAINYGPDFFIDENILVVIVSFRTSIFGFLNTEDDFAEGNMGAKDILTALKWLRDNISLFNGDPNRVTIIGSGTEATSVASMLVSVAADDLFTRAIVIDGSALSPADYRQNNFEICAKLYKKLKGRYDNFNRKELYNILRNLTTEQLLECRSLYDSSEVRDTQRLINTFSCGIEKSSKLPFMNKSPLEMYDRKLVNKHVDVIFGYTTLTHLYKLKGIDANRKLLKYLNYNFQYLLPFEGKSDEYNSERYKKIKREILNFYFLNGTIGERSLRRYAKYVSDQVIYPLLRQVELHSVYSDSNVYMYRLPFKGSLNIGWRSSVPNIEWSGATLGDEICYLFKCKFETDGYKSPKASNERLFIKKIVRLFANFARYGNPTPHGTDEILSALLWLPLGKNEKLRAMNLGRHFKMIDVPEDKRKIFWDQLKKEYF